ncbi:hypothetical protein [Bradyrhizobium sp. Leo121]|uniref:hypothetical protein n=1 Tax=Bradyrhizobium sp. Leo121 TaxID=1571195 RepID=UPI00102A379F|nr:hypothetical protein [Bradyrhizobium sp. Leo121]RZN33874.1 hypothetical protein CWO90_08555 [Bradyrhizobium sp. Leo121]
MPKNRVRFSEGRSMPAVNSTVLYKLWPNSKLLRRLDVAPLPFRRRSAGQHSWRSIAAAALTNFVYFTSLIVPALAQSAVIDLSHQRVGVPPRDFEFWHAGRSDRDRWNVVHEGAVDDDLAIQSSAADRDEQPSLAIYNPVAATDVRIRARFRLMKGSRPSAGLAMRVTSPDDYYLVRVGVFDQRLSLLHVVHGVPDEIAGVDADIAWNHWQTLEVAVSGDGFTMQLDGRWVLTAFDRGEHARGRCGIWTEHTDIARFDQIEIAPLPSVGDQSEPQRRLGG